MGDFHGPSPPAVEEQMLAGVEEEEYDKAGRADSGASDDEQSEEKGDEDDLETILVNMNNVNLTSDEGKEMDDTVEVDNGLECPVYPAMREGFCAFPSWSDDEDGEHQPPSEMEQSAWRWHNAPQNNVAPKVQGAGPPYPWWASSFRLPPCLPVFVGRTEDGGPLYVGRAWHMGHLLPANVAPTHNGGQFAYVAWAGSENCKFLHQFEVLQLLRGRDEWLEASGGDVPAHAFPVGILMDGRSVFVTRVTQDDGAVTLGRVVENDRCCYISYRGKERAFRNYEVLVIL